MVRRDKNITYSARGLLSFPSLLLPFLLCLGLVHFINFTHLQALLLSKRSSRLQHHPFRIAGAKYFLHGFHLDGFVGDPIIIENEMCWRPTVLELSLLALHRSLPTFGVVFFD